MNWTEDESRDKPQIKAAINGFFAGASPNGRGSVSAHFDSVRDLLSRADAECCSFVPSAGSKNGQHVFQLHFRIVLRSAVV